MSAIMDYIIAIGAVFGIAMACSLLSRKGIDFSMGIFLTSLAIGIAVLVWIPLIPQYMIVLSILIIISQLFKDGNPLERGVPTDE